MFSLPPPIFRCFRFLIDHKKVLFFYTICSIVVVISLSFLIRPWVLNRIDKQIDQIAEQKNIDIRYDNITIEGISTLSVEGLHIIPLLGDTLLKATEIKVSVDLWSLFLSKINISDLQISDLCVRFVKKEGYCNYDFLFHSPQPEQKSSSSPTHIARSLNLLFDLMFRFLPQQMQITDLQIESFNHQFYTQVASSSVEIKDHHFSVPLRITEEQRSSRWKIEGLLHKSARSISGNIVSDRQDEPFTIPYLKSVYNIFIGMKKMSFAFEVEKSSLSEVLFSGSFSTQNLALFYWRLASDTIYSGDVSFAFHCKADKRSIQIDSTSVLSLNQLKLHPSIEIGKEKDYTVKVSLSEKEISASKAIASLPEGLFPTLRPLQIEGTFGYRFLFDVDLSEPDSLILDAEVIDHRLQIKNSGVLPRMNSSFLYTAYQNQIPVRSFIIGQENPSFRQLNQISPYLQTAVLQSEDGSFYMHKGFRIDALREALIYDLKKRRFARGGSTISMQLVKNVFLSKEKNVFRKIEEAALVWLIENKQITSKARMFEVYMNIIEWGPMVYGAEEASRFYFDRPAADLSVEQSLFLATLIPSPQYFTSRIDSTGSVKEHTFQQMKIVAKRLTQLNLISDQEAENLSPLKITGPAVRYLSKPQELPDQELSQELY